LVPELVLVLVPEQVLEPELELEQVLELELEQVLEPEQEQEQVLEQEQEQEQEQERPLSRKNSPTGRPSLPLLSCSSLPICVCRRLSRWRGLLKYQMALKRRAD